MEIIPQVHWIPARGANVFLLRDQELTLIDTGMKGSAPRVLQYLSRLGYSPSQVARIIATHYHMDHVGSLAQLKRATGARVLVHRGDARIIRGELPQPFPTENRALALMIRPLSMVMGADPVEVDVALEDGDELPIFGGMKVIHVPGHTLGSICLFSPQKRLLIAGDVINNRFGRLRLAPRPTCTDFRLSRQSVRKLAGLDFDALCLGHGTPLTRGAAEEVRRLLSRLPPLA